MKEKYPVVFLCKIMGVSKSGYYKWKGRQGKLNRYEQDRQLLTKFLTEQHEKHPSHGYHMLADDVFQATGWIFSHNLAHKCCKEAGIRSKARKYRYKKQEGEEHIKFPNIVDGNWNADRPVQIVVSDMTVFKNNGKNWEWTLLVDTFNNEILAHQATPVTGSNKPYYHCLEVLNRLAGKKNEEQTPQVVFHTDQGSVYSSQAFQRAHEHYNILRSMSKGGTPTDNAIIEALNGWIKEELYLDFGLETVEDVPKLLDEYVYYFNNRRPAAALGYRSPVQYKTELGF
jgi:transposase InsO family protein